MRTAQRINRGATESHNLNVVVLAQVLTFQAEIDRVAGDVHLATVATGSDSRRYLTPPAVRPEMMRRWKSSTRTTRGITTMVPAAMIEA